MTLHRIQIALLLVCAVLLSPPVTALSCGDGVYGNITLTEDLHCDTGYVALEVFQSGVTIDLNGHTISGTSDLAGIQLIGYKNVSIKNGVIKGVWAGVNSTRSNYLSVSNMMFYEVGTGVIITEGNLGTVTGNDFININGNAVSLKVWDSARTANKNTISNNEFYRVGTGIQVCGDQADYNIISDNLIWKSRDRGIDLNAADRNSIEGNRILETSSGAGIRLNNASYNTFTNNSIQSGGHVALSILADAGGACLNTGAKRSVKNRAIGNLMSEFSTAIVMGLGVSSSTHVEGNGLLDNRIYNNTLGILFQSDTRSNYARDNDFSGTTTPVNDYGVNNYY